MQQACSPDVLRSVSALVPIARARAPEPCIIPGCSAERLRRHVTLRGSVQSVRPMSTGHCFSISNMVSEAHTDSRLKHLRACGSQLTHRGTRNRLVLTRIGSAWRGRREWADGCGIGQWARWDVPRPSGASPPPRHVDLQSSPDGLATYESTPCRCRGAASRNRFFDSSDRHYDRDRTWHYHFHITDVNQKSRPRSAHAFSCGLD